MIIYYRIMEKKERKENNKENWFTLAPLPTKWSKSSTMQSWPKLVAATWALCKLEELDAPIFQIMCLSARSPIYTINAIQLIITLVELVHHKTLRPLRSLFGPDRYNANPTPYSPWSDSSIHRALWGDVGGSQGAIQAVDDNLMVWLGLISCSILWSNQK